MEAEERIPGNILIWCSGNDIYSRTGPLEITDDMLERVAALASSVVGRVECHADRVYVLGPLPRLLARERGAKWERTVAFHLERKLLSTLNSSSGQVIPLGRALTNKTGKNKRALREDDGFLRNDGVHVTRTGYAKIAATASFPEWLTM